MLTAAAIDGQLAHLRAHEFGRLDHAGLAYLDYAGAALHTESQARQYQSLLSETIFGNPHSDHEPSRASTAAIDAARERVLRCFNVSGATHAVCFTANCTAAIKLVAESYPFAPGRDLVLTADNHNSINGLREFARRVGARVHVLPLRPDLTLDDPIGRLDDMTAAGGGLLACPAQSNFSGVRHPLSLVDAARQRGWHVLLDAAALVASAPLDLATCAADFVVVSFYKIFGLPTGVGALVARRDALDVLVRPWFAGGTVTYASVQHERHRLRDSIEAFEDGTPDFLAIAALGAGFAMIDAITLPRIGRHAAALANLLVEQLRGLRHANGAPMVEIYGPADRRECGATVAFNVVDASGAAVRYPIVETRARTARIAVRGGCFCNPGAAETAFRFPVDRTAACFDVLNESFSIDRFADCLGSSSPTGAVRASLGLANNESDVRRLVDVIASFAV